MRRISPSHPRRLTDFPSSCWTYKRRRFAGWIAIDVLMHWPTNRAKSRVRTGRDSAARKIPAFAPAPARLRMRTADDLMFCNRLGGTKHFISVVSQMMHNAVNEREGAKLHFESSNCRPISTCSSSIATPIDTASEDGFWLSTRRSSR